MKKIIVIVMLVMAGFMVKAQPSSGKLFVGGDFSISGSVDKQKSGSTTEVQNKGFHFELSPMIGFFLSDKLAVGAKLGLTTDQTKYPDATLEKVTSTGFSFSPFGRYYLISGNGGIFVQANAGIGVSTSKNHFDNTTTETNYFMFDIGLRPGVYYYITPKLALEGMFGWFGFNTSISKNGDNKNISNDFGLNFETSYLAFGFTYTIN